MKEVRLNNGVKMPALGYGVFLVSPEECERCVLDAISSGYRLIDTAQAYFNEEGVGAAISKCGVPRDEIFITTKVWISNAGEEKAAKSIDESLRKLRTDYVDLLLIHQAYGDVYGSWRAMEKALAEGKARAIGVSNFQAGRFVDFTMHVDVKPAVNPLLGQIGSRYGKTASQVALRWLVQRGIAAIPKSTRRERMEQNIGIFDFTLSDAEMKQIASLNMHDEGTVNFNDPGFIRYLAEAY